MTQRTLSSIQNRLFIGFCVAIGLLLSGFGLSYYQHSREEENNRQMAHTQSVVDQLRQLQALVVDAETSTRGYVATSNPLFLDPYRQAQPQIPPRLNRLRDLLAGNSVQHRRFAQLQATIQEKLAVSTQLIAQVRAKKQPEQLRQLLTAGQQRMAEIRQQVTTMIATEEQGMAQRTQQVHAGYVTTNWLIVLLTGLSIGLLVLAFVLLTQELTRRQRAEETARQQAQTIQTIFDMSMVNMVSYSAVRNEQGDIVDYRYELVNQTALNDAGLSVDDMVGRPLLAVFPQLQHSMAGDTGLSVLAIRKQVIETGIPVRYEMTFRHASGVDQWYLIETVKNGDGLLVTGLNITERKRMELQAEQQADLLRSVLDGSPNAIIAFDAVRDPAGQVIDFRYVLQNEINRQRVGRSDDVLLGRTMLEFFPEVATNGLLAQYAQVVDTGQPLRFESEFTYNGNTGWFGYSVVKRGNGIVLTVQDKTGEHQAHRIVEEANHELKKSNESLQSFAFIASHDLQEPLRKIKAFSDLVLHDYGPLLPGEGTDMLQRVQSAASRMEILIRDLLALSRLSTQQRPFGQVDLNELLAGVMSDLETTIAEKKAVINVPTLPVVIGDSLQLQQVFQNLLTNALKFQKTGQIPMIQIDCQQIPLAQMPPNLLSPNWMIENRLAGKQPQFYYALTVTDNGIGFDAEKYGEQVFRAFQRLQARSSQYSGTGIGLAIVKKVAETHGGAITVTSQEHQGATFTLYLPVVNPIPSATNLVGLSDR